jgi:hypothetical protein
MTVMFEHVEARLLDKRTQLADVILPPRLPRHGEFPNTANPPGSRGRLITSFSASTLGWPTASTAERQARACASSTSPRTCSTYFGSSFSMSNPLQNVMLS